MYVLLHKILRLLAYRDQYTRELTLERGLAYLSRAEKYRAEREAGTHDCRLEHLIISELRTVISEMQNAAS